MANEEKLNACDKFSGRLESPGTYRKATNDFGVTFAVPVDRVEYIQPLMQKADKFFAIFPVQVESQEEADALLNKNAPASLPAPAAGQKAVTGCPSISLADLAALLDVDERTVQLYEERGLVVRVSRGLYDRDRTIAAMNKARKDAENNISDEHRGEKILILREQRIKLAALNKERLGQLMNAEKTRQAIEHIGAEDRQALLNMPKTLGPQCDMLPGREVEIKLMDWVRRHLKEESAWDRIVGLVRTALSAHGKGKGKKRKKKK